SLHRRTLVVALIALPETFLRIDRFRGTMFNMTRKQVESAIESGAPFTLRMADGKEYAVPPPDYIWLPPNASYAIVHEDDGHFTVLPLLTMTGLRSKPAEGAGKKK